MRTKSQVGRHAIGDHHHAELVENLIGPVIIVELPTPVGAGDDLKGRRQEGDDLVDHMVDYVLK